MFGWQKAGRKELKYMEREELLTRISEIVEKAHCTLDAGFPAVSDEHLDDLYELLTKEFFPIRTPDCE